MVHTEQENRSFEAIGIRLRQARDSWGMTQTAFAEKVGIAQGAWNQYERGKKRPSVDNAMRICDVYGLTLDWIYFGNPAGLSFQLAQQLGLIDSKENKSIRYETKTISPQIGFAETTPKK